MMEDKLFEAFSYIDEDIISSASTDLFEGVPKKNVRKKVVLCVACITLSLTLLLSMIPLYMVLNKNRIDITPRDIEMLFENEESNDNFKLLSTAELEYYGYKDLSGNVESAYVFEKVALSDKDKEHCADKYLDAIRSNYSQSLSFDTVSQNEYKLITEDASYFVSFDDYRTRYEVITAADRKIVSENADKNSLKDSLLPVEDYVKDLFGIKSLLTDRSEMSVLAYADTGEVTLRIWCGENGESLDHVDFKFIRDNIGTYRLASITCEKLSLKKIMTDLISTEKGQKMVNNGYTFANGFNCSICDRGLAFDDDCECMLVYYNPAGEENTASYLIPFYAFRMKVAEDLYAVTYVPAIEIPGLYGYFRQKHEEHIKAEHENEVPADDNVVHEGVYTGVFNGVVAKLEMVDSQNATLTFTATSPFEDDSVTFLGNLLVTATHTWRGRAHMAGNVLTLQVSSDILSQLSLSGEGKNEYLKLKEDSLRQQLSLGKITEEQMQNTLDLLNSKGRVEEDNFTILQFTLDSSKDSFKVFREEIFTESRTLSRINMYKQGLLSECRTYKMGKLTSITYYIYNAFGELVGQTQKQY